MLIGYCDSATQGAAGHQRSPPSTPSDCLCHGTQPPGGLQKSLLCIQIRVFSVVRVWAASPNRMPSGDTGFAVNDKAVLVCGWVLFYGAQTLNLVVRWPVPRLAPYLCYQDWASPRLTIELQEMKQTSQRDTVSNSIVSNYHSGEQRFPAFLWPP